MWLEARPQKFIERVFIIPDLDNSEFSVTPEFNGIAKGDIININVSTPEGKRVASLSAPAKDGFPSIKIANAHAWSPTDPFYTILSLYLKPSSGRLIM